MYAFALDGAKRPGQASRLRRIRDGPAMASMKIVDRYIGRNVIGATLTVLVVLLAIFTFFALNPGIFFMQATIFSFLM